MAEVSKTGDAMGRGSWRSSFLGAPGAEFLRETSARKNFLGTGATSPPSPRFPGTWGEGRKIQATASVPKKTVSLEGCTSADSAQFCAHHRTLLSATDYRAPMGNLLLTC